MSRNEKFLLLLILLAALFIRLPHITDEFIRPHEAENAIYGLAARNHLRYGPVVTGLANCLSTGESVPKAPDRYLNHPGTLSLLLAASFAILGESPASTRIVPLLFCLMGLVIFHAAVRRRYDARTAFTALTAAAFAPSWIYFGKLATHPPFVVPFVLLLADRFGSAAVDEADPARRHREAILLGFLSFAACSIDFGGAFIVPALLIAYGPGRRLIPVVLGAALAFSLFAAQGLWLGGPDAILSLFHKGVMRAGSDSTFGVLDFIRVQAIDRFAWSAFTPVGALVATAGIFHAGRTVTERTRFLLAILLWGAGYILAFSEAAMVHDYWQYFLIPSAALLFAIMLSHRSRFTAAVLLILFLDQSLRIVERRYYSDIGWYDREFAAIAWAREHGKVSDEIWTKDAMRTWHPAYYADRKFSHHPELTDSYSLPIGPPR